MYKLAFWISITLLVTSLVVLGPIMNSAVAATAESQPQAGGQAEASDDEIEASINSAYTADAQLKPYAIGVDVQQGEVILSGEVDTPAQRDQAEYVAAEQPGVSAVHNQLSVAANEAEPNAAPTPQAEAGPPTGDDKESGLTATLRDAGITAKVKSRLLLHVGIASLAINVDTTDQVVDLNGTLKDPDLIPVVTRIAETTSGVREVNNNLRADSPTA